MWGGMTNPKELRAIADVAGQFAIPAVKVTGGQRIDLLGVKKEDLPAVWGTSTPLGWCRALPMPRDCGRSRPASARTGAASAPRIRPGSASGWKSSCGAPGAGQGQARRFGCPRNCAEATCKDIGVICVDSVLRHPLRRCCRARHQGTELLCHADSEDEAHEIIVALTQLYREQGAVSRTHLQIGPSASARPRSRPMSSTIWPSARTITSALRPFPDLCQVDPWKKRVNGKDAHEFAAMGGIRRAHGSGVTIVSNWIDLGSLDAIPRRGARCVLSPAAKLPSSGRRRTRSFALENRCPHRGGPLAEGIVHGASVTCPLHNWVFDLATGKATGADEGAVRTYPVNVVDGRVYMGFDEQIVAAAE